MTDERIDVQADRITFTLKEGHTKLPSYTATVGPEINALDDMSGEYVRLSDHTSLLEAERQRDNPEYDATDGAHPAWWRGHDWTSGEFARLVAMWLKGEGLDGQMCAEWQAVKDGVADLRQRAEAAEANQLTDWHQWALKHMQALRNGIALMTTQGLGDDEIEALPRKVIEALGLKEPFEGRGTDVLGAIASLRADLQAKEADFTAAQSALTDTIAELDQMRLDWQSTVQDKVDLNFRVEQLQFQLSLITAQAEQAKGDAIAECTRIVVAAFPCECLGVGHWATCNRPIGNAILKAFNCLLPATAEEEGDES